MIWSAKGIDLEVPRGTCPDGRPWYFVQVPHNASTAMSKALGVKPRQHLTAAQIRREVGGEMNWVGALAWVDSIVFGVVRNPWDRVVSQYLYRKRRNGRSGYVGDATFVEWVQKTYAERDERYINNPLMFEPQHTFLDGFTHVLRYENLDVEWARFAPQISASRTLPIANASTDRRPYAKYYTMQARATITKAHGIDIDTYGYSY